MSAFPWHHLTSGKVHFDIWQTVTVLSGSDTVRSVLPPVPQGHVSQRTGILSSQKPTHKCPSNHGRGEEIQAQFLRCDLQNQHDCRIQNQSVYTLEQWLIVSLDMRNCPRSGIIFPRTSKFLKIVCEGEKVRKRGCISSSTWYKLSFEPSHTSVCFVSLL